MGNDGPALVNIPPTAPRRWLGPALLAVALAAGGCISGAAGPEQVYNDRVAVYERWQRGREADAETLPVLSGRLSLADAVKVALAYNKSLLAVLQDKRIARGRVVASYAEALPTVTAQASYTRLDEVTSFNAGGQWISTGELDNYAVDLSVRQPVYRGGAIRSAIRGAELFAHLTDETVRAGVQAVVYDVAATYYATLLARQLYEVNRQAVVSAEAHLADVRTKAEQGVASRFDVLRAQVDVSNFQAEMIRQQNRLNLARTRLLKTMGASQDTQVVLSDELTYHPIEPSEAEAVRLAYLRRPDLYRAELAVRLQSEAVRIARSAYWPRIDALFTQGWARPDPHTSTDDWGDRWTAGVQAEIPIFDGLRREGRLIEEKAALARRRIERDDATDQALLEIRQALLSVEDAEQFVASQRLNLERAHEGLRLAEVGYREGVNTEVEVVDARAALTRARGLYYQAVHDHALARLALQRATGGLAPPPGETAVEAVPALRPPHEEALEPTSAPAGANNE